MAKRRIIASCVLTACLLGGGLQAQTLGGGTVSGGVQIDGQVCRADSTIGATEAPERLLMNARADVLYRNGGFSAGLRFEMYQNPLPGFDSRYRGQGIANWFAAYDGERLSLTAGHYYEQFGSGMTLRAYEDRYLGVDNSLLGLKAVWRPKEGLTLKALAGRQRWFWELGEGLVRGVDAEADLMSLVGRWADSPVRATLGGSFVSRYQEAETVAAEEAGRILNLPLNVGIGAVRATLGWKGWRLEGEYARKGQDPSATNGYIYHPGHALMLSADYSQRGFSASVQGRRVDNMGFKSMRGETGEALYINYLPAITRQQTYSLASMYPYATNLMGEQGLQADLLYRLPKQTPLGGPYGTTLHLNAAVVCTADTLRTGGAGTEGYTLGNSVGDLLYGDATVEISRKLNKSLKATLTYTYQVFNPAVENEIGELVHSSIVVADCSWKLNRRHSLRFEAQWMGSDSRYDAAAGHTDARAGDWLMGLVEWNVGSHWFLSLADEYAYHDGRGNYPTVSLAYTHGATRLQIGYGKQRKGLLCVGGVCRPVPASNGLNFSLTTSF